MNNPDQTWVEMTKKQPRPPKSKDELSWLFNSCESEMGVKSNFNSLILASKYGTKRTRIDADTGDLTNAAQEDLFNEDTLIDAIDTRKALGRLAATSKNRRVMAVYGRLHVMHQRIFEAAFEARQYPPEVSQIFGDFAGVAPLTATARSIARFDWAWLAAAIVRKDPKASLIKREAERLYKDALQAYERAVRETPEEAPQ